MPDTCPSRTESSTEAMDTDEGQRTSARLLEEAQRLSQEAHTYTTIKEQQKVGAKKDLMQQFLTYCQHRILENLLCQLWENTDQFQPR